MTMTIKTTRQLKNGVHIPILGLGTWQIADGQQTKSALRSAFEVGYRHIDTAMIYANERSIGQAVRDAGIPRSEIFVTTKLWNSDHGYDQTIRAFNESLGQLALDYIDLYLIHWPVEGQRLDTWRAMETLLALTVGGLFTAGLYLMMRRSIVKLVIGMALLGNAANLLIFTCGRLTRAAIPFIPGDADHVANVADPLPQALILTAIVIGFGVQAFAIVLVKSAYETVGTDDLEEMTSTDT